MTNRIIDQIDILRPVIGKTEFKKLWALISNMEGVGKASLPQGWFAKVVLKNTSKLVLLKRKNKYGPPFAAVELGVSPKGKRWLKLRVYPQNFQDAEFADLQHFLHTYFGYSYSTFFNYGRITRLDIAVDCSIFSLSNSLPTIKAFKRSHRFIAGDGLGALYLGSPTALRVYDKKKQLAQKKKKAVPYGVWTRFERILRNLACSPAELIDKMVADPLGVVQITPLEAAKGQLAADPHWGGFLVMCECEGIPAALSKQPHNRRVKFKHVLAGHSTGLPSPKNWKGNLLKMIQKIQPAE